MNFRSYFHFKWIPEREREREKRPPSFSPVQQSPANPELQSALIARTSRSRELQSDDRTAPIAPSISRALVQRSHLRSRLQPTNLQPTDLSLCVILIFVVVVVVWWWCFGGCGFWLPEFAVVGWIAVWKICRTIFFSTIQPNTRKYFSQHFLKCNQTPENHLHETNTTLILPGLCYSCLNKSFLCSKNITHFFHIFFYSYIFPKKITLLKIYYQTGQIAGIILHLISQKYIYVHIYLICVSYCDWLLITIVWTHHFLSTIYNLPNRQLWHKFYYFMWF